MEQYDVFVSYNRHDARLVEGVVQLLRSEGRRVFWDDDIVAGRRWAEEIVNAIRGAKTLVVVWCCRAAASEHVTAEIQLAHDGEKGFRPVLLCSFPVPPPLNEFQWVDFRAAGHDCTHHEQEGPSGDGQSAQTLVKNELGPAHAWAGAALRANVAATLRYASSPVSAAPASVLDA